MENGHERLKEMKRGLKKLGGRGNNAEIAELLESTENSVKNMSQPNKELTNALRGLINMYEKYVRPHVPK